MRSAGLVLAAGGSSRMGSPKQLLRLDGRPLLELVLSAVNGSRLDDVVVVLGGAADRIRAEVDVGRARVVVNPDYTTGMSSSLRAGLNSLGPEVERVVVILGDQPAVTADLLNRLLALKASSDRPRRSASRACCTRRWSWSAHCGRGWRHWRATSAAGA